MLCDSAGGLLTLACAVDILPGQGSEERNAPERFEKAFEGLDKSLWHVFDEPDELYEKLDTMVKAFA